MGNPQQTAAAHGLQAAGDVALIAPAFWQVTTFRGQRDTRAAIRGIVQDIDGDTRRPR